MATDRKRTFGEDFEAYLRMMVERKKRLEKERLIQNPPDLLLEAQRSLYKEGFDIFDPICFPFGEEKYWALIDRSKRPDYDSGQRMFENDPLGPMLKAVREKVRDGVNLEVPKSSRFGVMPQVQDMYIFPELAKVAGLEDSIKTGKVKIQRPTDKEFVFAGDLRYAHFGLADTSEWLQDIAIVPEFTHRVDVIIPLRYRIISGNATQGGLRHKKGFFENVIPKNFDSIAFRPVITFL